MNFYKIMKNIREELAKGWREAAWGADLGLVQAQLRDTRQADRFVVDGVKRAHLTERTL